VDVAKVLQNLFNLLLFTDPDKTYMFAVNKFIEDSKKKVEAYLDKVVDVRDPEEYLEVDQYNELVQRAKPVIVISTHEIVRIHTMVEKHLAKLAPDNDDNLRVIMKDLGPVPPLPSTEKDIQLWLSNRFKADVPEDPEEKKLYNATKELVLPVLRQVPIEQSIRKLNLMDVLEAGIKHAAATNNKELSNQINKILENISKLEEYGMVTKDDNYESFVHAVALEVANRATIRENQRKEISRLNAALNKLRQHQSYIKDQIRDYNSYLQGARKAAYSVDPKKKKNKGTGPPGANPEQGRMGPFKFTYKELEKQGVIVDSEVPEFSRKACTFMISSDSYGVFNIVAKMAGLEVEQMTLELDDLLERRYNNIETLELDQVTLGVNMTIFLINSYFLKGKKK